MIPLKDNVPTHSVPFLTVALIVANIAIFVWAEHAPTERLATNLGVPVRVSGFTAVTAEYGFVPCEVRQSCPHGDDEVLLGCEDQLGRPVYAHVHHVPVLGERVHLDVHARQLGARARQHAVPVDLRQQHRGSPGPAPLRRLLPARRPGCGAAAVGGRPEL